jgi:hypothetical protein
MIVIYEQIYDIVSMLDIIEDDKLDDYIAHHGRQLLDKPHVIDILMERQGYNGDKSSYGSYSYQLKYDYEGEPVEWEGFDYVKFESINNFAKPKE